jgi:hypothetical protein
MQQLVAAVSVKGKLPVIQRFYGCYETNVHWELNLSLFMNIVLKSAVNGRIVGIIPDISEQSGKLKAKRPNQS